jgi:hypothetical protein
MGATIWVKTLEGRNYSSDKEDHSLLYHNADELDAVCVAAGVGKLSDFMDYTDMEYSFSDFDDDDEESAEGAEGQGGEQDEQDEQDEQMADPETGLGYGIDDMTWFDAVEGMACLKALREWAAGDGEPDRSDELLEELDHCISLLQGPASRGGKFHFAVIE